MRKLISLLLTTALLLNSYGGIFNVSADEAMEKAGLHFKTGVTDGVLLSFNTSINDDDFNPGFVVHTLDGVEYPAYCINPNKPGIKKAGEYDVDINEAINNPQVYGAVINGYPFKSPSELGVSTDYEAYYATTIAIWTLVHDTYSDVNDWAPYPDPGDTRVYDAMKNIRAKGVATTSITSPVGSITATASTPVARVDTIDSNYFSQTFTVSNNYDYTASLGGGAPSGTRITDVNNTNKSSFSAGEEFKVLIPKIGDNQSGNFNINISASGGGEGLTVLWGKSPDEDTQDYAVVSRGTTTTGQATSTYFEEAGEPETPEISLQIVKLANGTTIPLAGAIFRVTKADGGVIGDFVTDDNGQVTVMLDSYGVYYVEEITPPIGYQLGENSHKHISITKADDNILTFENKENSQLRITKVDADTGERLNGAVIRLAYDGGNDFTDVEIGLGGSATVENLREGTYTVTEIVAPSGYILDSTPHSIKLEAGKTAEIILRNSLKPGLLIKKFDETTGLPLGGAEFSVAEMGGSIVYEGITPQDGQIHLTDLNPGWYVVTEIAAPAGYLIATESKNVYLPDGKVVEIKFDNRLRPALQIVKLDYETNQPLEGAVFHVRKTESSTVGEYVTNANGTITIMDLEEDIYSVREVKAPEGYLLDEQHKDVKLEWGKVTTLVFTNRLKPKLTIYKYDELTNEPLSGASFRLRKTDPGIPATSETWSETLITDSDGRITWTDLDHGIYSIQEIDEPYGYFKDPDRKEILLEGGDNKQLEFFNRPRPVITIRKRDQITGQPLSGVKFKVERLEGETIGEFLTDANGMIELSPRTGYLLDEKIYRVTEITPPSNYLLSENVTKNVLLKWYEPTELVFENLLKPTLIFIKRDGMSGRGISGATYRVQYESPDGGVITLGNYVTKCGLVVMPYVMPGWYVLTETLPASGYSLPTNPVQRFYLAPGENSYTYEQTKTDLYVDPRTNPNSGNQGACGEWCGYMCSVLCDGNCGNAGDGTTSVGTGGSFGNITITNGNGKPIIGGAINPTDPTTPTLTAGTVTRISDMTATVAFTSSVAGRYYYSVVNSGANEPTVGTGGLGAICTAGNNTITVYMTSGAKDVYIKVKDDDGKVSDALKISVQAYSTEQTQTSTPPSFDDITITGGTVVYLNPDFSDLIIKFGNY